MVTSDWQLTVQCLFYTPSRFYFFVPHFRCSLLPPFTSQAACLLALAAAPKFNLSLTEVLVMFNPFRVLRWENQSHAGWVGEGEGRGSGERRKTRLSCQLPPDHLFMCARGIFFSRSFPSTWEGNPWERARGQTYLGKVSQGKVCTRKTSSSSFFGHAKLCQGDRRWTYRGAMLEPARGRSSREKKSALEWKILAAQEYLPLPVTPNCSQAARFCFFVFFKRSSATAKVIIPAANVVSSAENYY